MAKQKKTGDPQVTVRMYRQGLGDCFLISLRAAGKPPYHMLIDCGVWDQSTVARAKLKRCVADIRTRTRKNLDLLVVTHEHWDHVSGFSAQQARAEFEGINIKNVLLPWTENPQDDLASDMREKYAAMKEQLRVALGQAIKAGLGVGRAAESVLAAAGLGFGANPSEALGWVKSLKKPGEGLAFADPGMVIPIPGARLYVLGPPRNKDLLRKPQGGEKTKKSGETYLGASDLAEIGLSLSGDFGSALAAASRLGKADPWDDPFAPFHPRVGFSFPRKGGKALTGDAQRRHEQSMEFMRAVYLRKGSPPHSDNSWRRIDDDWASPMSHFALRMDRFTNNTSLVLAIELEGSNRVLLFPADAQYGSWMSWDDVKFPDRPGVTAEDLLRRTVLYKVGHHGSHNATLRKRGIDRMTSPDLIAMIPVDEAFASKQPPKGWEMPYKLLYSDLIVRTRGRVLRADTGVPKPALVEQEVRDDFFKSVKVSPLSVQLQI